MLCNSSHIVLFLHEPFAPNSHRWHATFNGGPAQEEIIQYGCRHLTGCCHCYRFFPSAGSCFSYSLTCSSYPLFPHCGLPLSMGPEAVNGEPSDYCVSVCVCVSLFLSPMHSETAARIELKFGERVRVALPRILH